MFHSMLQRSFCALQNCNRSEVFCSQYCITLCPFSRWQTLLSEVTYTALHFYIISIHTAGYTEAIQSKHLVLNGRVVPGNQTCNLVATRPFPYPSYNTANQHSIPSKLQSFSRVHFFQNSVHILLQQHTANHSTKTLALVFSKKNTLLIITQRPKNTNGEHYSRCILLPIFDKVNHFVPSNFFFSSFVIVDGGRNV